MKNKNTYTHTHTELTNITHTFGAYELDRTHTIIQNTQIVGIIHMTYGLEWLPN